MTSGGTERVVSNLLNHWVKKASKVVLVLYSRPAEIFYFVDPRVEIIFLIGDNDSYAVRFLGPTLGNVVRLRRIISAVQPSVVLGFLPQVNLALLFATFGMIKTPKIISERNLISHRKIPRKWRILRYLFYRSASFVTINSEWNRKFLKNYVRAEKIRFLPNPVSFPKVPQTRERRKVVLAVGRFIHQKGFDLLIKGFARSRASEVGWKLEIYGDGPNRTLLQAMARKEGIEQFVKLMPATSDLEEKWGCASIFALPSRYEGMPNALIEALSCGLIPLVSRGVGELTEEIEKIDPTLVVNVDSEEEFGAALGKLVSRIDYFSALSEQFKEIAKPFEKGLALESWSRLLSESMDTRS